jgi:hypothetical protein
VSSAVHVDAVYYGLLIRNWKFITGAFLALALGEVSLSLISGGWSGRLDYLVTPGLWVTCILLRVGYLRMKQRRQ